MKLINAEKRVKFKDLSKPVKIKRVSVLVCEGLIALAGLIALIVWMSMGDPKNRMMNCLNTAFLTMLLWVAELIIGRRFSFGQHIAYIIFMLFGSFMGSCLFLFESVSFYDELMHGVGGYLICIPIMGVLFAFVKGLDKSNIAVSAVTILFVSLGTATLWEVIEFTMDILFAQNGLGYASPEVLEKIKEMGLTGVAASWYKVQQVSVFDTITDMSLHTIGSLVFTLHYVIHRLSKKNLLMGYLVEDATNNEMNTKAVGIEANTESIVAVEANNSVNVDEASDENNSVIDKDDNENN